MTHDALRPAELKLALLSWVYLAKKDCKEASRVAIIFVDLYSRWDSACLEPYIY